MMNDLIVNFLIIVFGVLIGLFIGRLLQKLKGEKEKSALEGQISLSQSAKENAEKSAIELQKELKFLQQEKESLITTNSRQDADLRNLQLKLNENKDEVNKLQEKFTKEFENLANKILEENSTKFKAQNKESLWRPNITDTDRCRKAT